MNNVFDELNEINESLLEKVDFKAVAKQLERVDTLKYADTDVLIRAEYGCGKTYSLRSIAHEALYVCHRRSLVNENLHFKKAICINSLPSVKLDDYKYLILDELVGIFQGLYWEKVDYLSVAEKLMSFEGRIISLDANGNLRDSELLSLLTSRNIKYVQHKTTSREKPVLLTEDINAFINLALQAEPGVKLIVCDTVKQAKKLFEKRYDVDNDCKHLATGSGNTVAPILEKVKADGRGWIFASPVIESGLSLEGPLFTFNGIVRESNGSKMPIDNGMQALHRVRNRAAIRAVCILSAGKRKHQAHTEEEISLRLEADTLVALDLVKDHIAYTRDKSSKGYWQLSSRKAGFDIFAYQTSQTSIQNENYRELWVERLEVSGYTVIKGEGFSNKVDLQLDETAKEETKVYNVLYDSSHRDFAWANTSDDFEQAYPEDYSKQRLFLLKHFRAEVANNPETDYFKCQNAFKKRWQIGTNSSLTMNEGAVFYEPDRKRVELFGQILRETIGVTQWVFYGRPESLKEFTVAKADVYAHPEFAKLRALCNKQGSSRERWFWSLAKEYGFTTRKSKDKQIIANDIKLDLSNNDTKEGVLKGKPLTSEERDTIKPLVKVP